jgi:hypothetical protein
MSNVQKFVLQWHRSVVVDKGVNIPQNLAIERAVRYDLCVMNNEMTIGRKIST